MRFHQPDTVDGAARLLAADEGARCVAGGATLVAMMNADLVAPSALVSLRGIAELGAIERQGDGSVRIGAMTRHRAVAAFAGYDRGQAVLAEAAAAIGHPAIRNMGTIGGAIAHADAAADYPACLVAADAAVEIAGAGARREVGAADFFVDDLETALEPGELVVGVRLPPAPEAVGAYAKLARVEGDFATVSAAAIVAMDGDVCRNIRLAVGACASTPVRVAAAEEVLEGTRLEAADIDRAAAAIVAACDPVSDFRGSAAYRLALVPVMLRRAVAAAGQRAGAGQ